MNQSRQYNLDALRGVAALIVVIKHYLSMFSPYTLQGTQGCYQQQFLWETIFFYPPVGILVAGRVAIALFFIISGYVLSYQYLGGETRKTKKILAAIIRRPIRLGGLVLFSIILSSCLWYTELYFNKPVNELYLNNVNSDIHNLKPCFTPYFESSFSLQKLATDLMTKMFSSGDIYNPPLWTIKIELYGSMLVFLFVLILGRFKYRLLILFGLVFYYRGSGYDSIFIGVILADFVKNHNFIAKMESKYFISVPLWIMFIYFSSYPYYVNSSFIKLTIYGILPLDERYRVIYSMLPALSLFIIVIINNQIKRLLNYSLFQFLGRVSYGVYVVHFLVISSISSWLFLRLSPHLGYGLSFLFILLSGISISYLFAYWITIYIDNPATKVASYISKKLIDAANSGTLNNVRKNITNRYT